MPGFVADLDDDMLRHLVETLTESGQAICLYDAEDRLRFANKAYQDLFLGDYEGPFTFPEILRYAHAHGLGVRIDDGDVDAFIARTLPGAGLLRASPSRPTSSMAAGSGWIIPSCPMAGC